MIPIDKNRLDALKEEGKKSKIYRRYQLIGLMIAGLLNDDAHKALYIKLAKKYNNEELLMLAKDISTRRNVSNKGAYFMKVLFKKKDSRASIYR